MKLNAMSIFTLLLVMPILALLLGACSPANANQSSETPVPLPPGDAAHGAELFTTSVNGAPPCSTCHQTDDTTIVGPGMKGFSQRAGSRVSGETAEQYVQESITHPASFVVSGFPNAMYNQYGSKLSPQDIADLMAYLLTL